MPFSPAHDRGEPSFCRILGGILGKHFVLFEADGADHEGYTRDFIQRDIKGRVFLII